MKKYNKKEKITIYEESEHQKKLYREFKERENKRKERQELLKYCNNVCKLYKEGVLWNQEY